VKQRHNRGHSPRGVRLEGLVTRRDTESIENVAQAGANEIKGFSCNQVEPVNAPALSRLVRRNEVEGLPRWP
jgi:hypothetical protein